MLFISYCGCNITSPSQRTVLNAKLPTLPELGFAECPSSPPPPADAPLSQVFRPGGHARGRRATYASHIVFAFPPIILLTCSRTVHYIPVARFPPVCLCA